MESVSDAAAVLTLNFSGKEFDNSSTRSRASGWVKRSSSRLRSALSLICAQRLGRGFFLASRSSSEGYLLTYLIYFRKDRDVW